MNSKDFFIRVSNFILILNLLIGLAAISFLDRLGSAIDGVLQKNSLVIEATQHMQEVLHQSSEDLDQLDNYKKDFDFHFEQTKGSHSNNKENELIEDIGMKSDLFFKGKISVYKELSLKILKLAEFKLTEMRGRQEEAKFLSQTGAWSLGFLVLITLLLQLILRARILNQLINPMRLMCKVINDYSKGNKLRRYHYLNCSEDVKTAGHSLNKILDRKEGIS